jgi:hypothetical protein
MPEMTVVLDEVSAEALLFELRQRRQAGALPERVTLVASRFGEAAWQFMGAENVATLTSALEAATYLRSTLCASAG